MSEDAQEQDWLEIFAGTNQLEFLPVVTGLLCEIDTAKGRESITLNNEQVEQVYNYLKKYLDAVSE